MADTKVPAIILYAIIRKRSKRNAKEIHDAKYYFNNVRPVHRLKGKPPVLFRTELVA